MFLYHIKLWKTIVEKVLLCGKVKTSTYVLHMLWHLCFHSTVEVFYIKSPYLTMNNPDTVSSSCKIVM